MATNSTIIFQKQCNMHPEKLSMYSEMMYKRCEVQQGLLNLALWSDEFHVLATSSQEKLPQIPTKQVTGWALSWYRQDDEMKSL
jgi:hypothetical protein